MDVYDRRRERLRLLLREITAADLARRSGVAATLITRYKAEPEHPGSKNLGEENARKIEAGAGKPPGWLDRLHVAEPPPPYGGTHLGGGADAPMAQEVSQWPRNVTPVLRTWELLMDGPLEPEFQTVMPDASMAPEVRKGATIVCISGVDPVPGDFVLVADAAGTCYLREYRQTRPGSWEAHALNPAYLPMHSERDQLTVLAVFNGVLGRRSDR